MGFTQKTEELGAVHLGAFNLLYRLGCILQSFFGKPKSHDPHVQLKKITVYGFVFMMEHDTFLTNLSSVMF